MNRKRICVVLTAHNRREKTLAALAAYWAQGDHLDLRAIVMDDGSTDGTANAIRSTYPEVRILSGDGSRFWNRGMALAFNRAREEDHDFFLWLNDDTVLLPGALDELLGTWETAVQLAENRIIVGSTRDPVSRTHTYGGVRRTSQWHPGKFEMVHPGPGIQCCDTMNGNIVLIPRGVADLVGGIDEVFSHRIGDYDYGLRSRQKGAAVLIGPGFQGECSRNPPDMSWKRARSFRERVCRAFSPKGLPPHEWAYFLRKHGTVAWPLAWLATYRRLILGL